MVRELNLRKRLTWSECPIKDPPVIISPATNTSYRVSEGSNTTLDCRTTGDPAPEITWYQDGELLTEGVVVSPAMVVGDGSGSGEGSGNLGEIGIVLQLVSSTLTLAQTTANDSGLYSCQAGNAAGNVSVDVLVTVLGTSKRNFCCKKYFRQCYLMVDMFSIFPPPSLSSTLSISFLSFLFFHSHLSSSVCLSVCLSHYPSPSLVLPSSLLSYYLTCT